MVKHPYSIGLNADFQDPVYRVSQRRTPFPAVQLPPKRFISSTSADLPFARATRRASRIAPRENNFIH
jgi:hypothetical protein